MGTHAHGVAGTIGEDSPGARPFLQTLLPGGAGPPRALCRNSSRAAGLALGIPRASPLPAWLHRGWVQRVSVLQRGW